MILIAYISMKHFIVSISSHPKTLLLKHLTWSMPMCSGTWTRLYQKEAKTFPQGQYNFTNQNHNFLFLNLIYLHEEVNILCWLAPLGAIHFG